MDYKIIFGIVAIIVTSIAFLPYLKDIFAQKTKPHIYSWLIWSILQTTGTIAMIVGHASWGAFGLGIGSLFCIFIFFLSFKYGTKNITSFDTFCLIGAISAIMVWIFTRDPFYSVILISVIDSTGFIPTLRKAYSNPHSETTSLYYLNIIADIIGLFAINNYSITTTLYLIILIVMNMITVIMLLIRKSHALSTKI